MDKQMIEEMAEVIEEAMAKARRTLGGHNNIAKFYATMLVNAGYRKADDLLKELQSMKSDFAKDMLEIKETYEKEVVDLINEVRKETVDKFAERLKAHYMPPLNEWDEIRIDSLFYEIDEIAKEIKEGL